MIGKITFIISMVIISVIIYIITGVLIWMGKTINMLIQQDSQIKEQLIKVHNNTLILENRINELENKLEEDKND